MAAAKGKGPTAAGKMLLDYTPMSDWKLLECLAERSIGCDATSEAVTSAWVFN
jgi:hypothetical protein